MHGDFFKASGARIFAVSAALVSGMASLKLYSHFFAPEIYGIMAVALQLIGYLPVLDGGFRTATNRQLLAVDETEKRRLILFSQTVYSWLLILAILAGGILMFCYGLFAHAQHDISGSAALFVTLGVCGALLVFANTQCGLLLGLGNQAAMSLVNGVGALVSVSALGAALFGGLGVWAFPLSILANAAITYFTSILVLRTIDSKIPGWRFSIDTDFWTIFRGIRSDAFRAFRSQFSIILLFSSDLILAGIFLPPSDVAVYAVLSRILSIARGFLQSFNEAAWPFIANQSKGFEAFQDWIVRANSLLYGLCGGALVAILPTFVRWYMGPQWEPSPILCWLFVIRFLVIGTAGPASYFLMGKGDFQSIARCTGAELLACTTFALVLTPAFGLSGIATAYLIGTAGGTLFPFWVIYARCRGYPLRPILISVWLRVIGAFTIAWIAGSFSLPHLRSLLNLPQ